MAFPKGSISHVENLSQSLETVIEGPLAQLLGCSVCPQRLVVVQITQWRRVT